MTTKAGSTKVSGSGSSGSASKAKKRGAGARVTRKNGRLVKPKPKQSVSSRPRLSLTTSGGRSVRFDSEGELTLFVQLLQAGIPEQHILVGHQFDPERKWKFDLAISIGADRSRSPKRRRIAIEIDGNGAGHTGFVGYRKDREKDHAAHFAGWVVLRFTTEMVMESDYALKTVLKCVGDSF